MRTGWWFGTWLLFFPSYWYTTNQRIYLFWMSGWSPHWDVNNSHLVIPKGWEKWQLFHNHFGIINNDDLVFYSSFCAESELSIMENRDSNGPNHLNILMFGNSRIGAQLLQTFVAINSHDEFSQNGLLTALGDACRFTLGDLMKNK